MSTTTISPFVFEQMSSKLLQLAASLEFIEVQVHRIDMVLDDHKSLSAETVEEIQELMDPNRTGIANIIGCLSAMAVGMDKATFVL